MYLSMWELKDEEVITWMDTSILIRRLLIELFKKGINAEQIQIVMEYPLVFGNHKIGRASCRERV